MKPILTYKHFLKVTLLSLFAICLVIFTISCTESYEKQGIRIRNSIELEYQAGGIPIWVYSEAMDYLNKAYHEGWITDIPDNYALYDSLFAHPELRHTYTSTISIIGTDTIRQVVSMFQDDSLRFVLQQSKKK
ncbi:hypothetical protein FACS189440_09780 [Bacteroidia bacterium]|nr:hypothetical protein FACS189423_00360 [Bacteroidia bacterium]GHT47863.1 hypothetical protein FACS189440_09780 [Bacteroidia bacterium]